jgi:hypothetical protein
MIAGCQNGIPVALCTRRGSILFNCLYGISKYRIRQQFSRNIFILFMPYRRVNRRYAERIRDRKTPISPFIRKAGFFMRKNFEKSASVDTGKNYRHYNFKNDRLLCIIEKLRRKIVHSGFYAV